MDIGIIGGADGPVTAYYTVTGGLFDVHSLPAYLALLVLACLMAYFLGNISPSTLLARAAGIDIKKEGSGNAGTTNALRVLGKKAAVITLVIDIAKGVAAVLIGWLLAGQLGAIGCALCVMLGHIWPILLKFKGGKGIATSFGALLALNPLLALLELVIVAIVTLVSKRMSAGSIAGLVCLPFLSLWLEPEFTLVAAVIAVIMLLKHRANIVRLLHGEEPVLGIFDKNREDRKNPGASEEKEALAAGQPGRKQAKTREEHKED